MYKYLFETLLSNLGEWEVYTASQKWDANSMFNFFKELPYSFPQHLHYFTFPLTVHRGSNFPTSLPTLVIFCFLDSSHPNGWEVVSHCGFDSRFPDD